ncbi:MAG: Hsp20/alpha crystallin family protein [Vicinamibacterales bacterium]
MTDPFQQDATDLADDARRLLQELDEAVPGAAAVNAECRPPVDVLETESAIEVVVDVPGVAAESLRVAIRRSTLLVVGAKLPPRIDPAARFHLAERGYGRFARAVRLIGALDSTRARAHVGGGQLRVVLPRVEERRGRLHHVPVERT